MSELNRYQKRKNQLIAKRKARLALENQRATLVAVSAKEGK